MKFSWVRRFYYIGQGLIILWDWVSFLIPMIGIIAVITLLANFNKLGV